MDRFYYRVKNGDALDKIAQKYGVNVADITRNNTEIPIYAGEIVRIDTSKSVLHIVKPAETIEQIAKHYNMSEEDLKSINSLTSTRLYIGQELKIKRD